MYVLDGNAFCQTVAESARIQARRSEKTGIPSAIVVGIGYPGAKDFFGDRRFYDFTPPADTQQLPPHPRGGEWPNHGGGALFIDFIEKELKPFIHSNYPVDINKQCLFGHSLGGLFTLYTLFNHTGSFQNYIASSPSLCWNNQAVLKDEQQLLNNLAAKPCTPNVFLASGSLEKEYMIEDPKALSERLTGEAGGRMRITYHLTEDENHLSIVPSVLSRALRFVFNDETTST